MKNKTIKITHFSTYDIEGGAARSAYRLHKAILDSGTESKMCVLNKFSNDPSITYIKNLASPIQLLYDQILTKLLRWKLLRYNKTRNFEYGSVSIPSTGYKKSVINNIPDCHIVNLHWIAKFIDYKYFFNNLPQSTKVVWRLSDLNPVTGGCHYDLGCGKYLSSCGACPLLGSSNQNDYSSEVWEEKREIFNTIKPARLHFVSQSRWMTEILHKSPLTNKFSVSTIPNGVNTGLFKPIDKMEARKSFNLQNDKKIIMYGAIGAITDKRKGFSELQDALNIAKENIQNNTQIVVFGVKCDKNHIDPKTGYYFIRKCGDDSTLAKLYSAADVIVAPSLQENLSNVVMESMSCGTPVVAFNIGGMPDMIDHKINGYLAEPYNIGDLANGIKWVLEDKEKNNALGINAKEKVIKEFNMELCTKRYLELYNSILENKL